MFNISMYVCCCLAVTDSEIEAHIVAGAGTLEAVMSCSRAGTRCGSCRTEIVEMIASRASSSGGHAAAAAITHPESISVMRQGSTNELPFRVDDGRVHLAVTLPEGGRGSRHNGFGVEHASVSHPVDRDGSASQEDTREDEERASAA